MSAAGFRALRAVKATYLLQDPTPIHLLRKTMDLALHLLAKYPFLALVAVDEEALHDIVAEDVAHELAGVGQNLAENAVSFVAVRSFELTLDELRAGLIAAELDNVVVNILA